MTLLEHLQNLNPEFSKFLIQEIKNSEGVTVGDRCHALDKNGTTFAGGTGATNDLAKRIAIAEVFERSFVRKIANDVELSKKFNMMKFPSSSGFAAGFENNSTKFRSICEGLERWIWSKWIDDNFYIEELLKERVLLSPLAKHLSSCFDEVFWYSKSFLISDHFTYPMALKIVIFLGCKDDGIYAGSRVSTENDDLFSHPIIEAQRNYQNFSLHQKGLSTQYDQDYIIKKRALYFGSHKGEALEQVARSFKRDWPTPKFSLLEEYNTEISNLFLYRCLFEDFMGWHLGPVDRFVY